MEIKAIGLTHRNPDGSVGLVMTNDMPEDCVVVFMSKEDYAELKVEVMRSRQETQK